ncbi:hypothetical protein NLJ89_g1324 [Agrocybe chaxingu]|uniref:Uncharacterized protein n=1 Tax=Agrocybe chaxingu TaxID=84603 RepID=A0A9W8N073_9AGAR|nr:hypothetical protein NLJ89_g1324 [Agrocybe chaxingu]
MGKHIVVLDTSEAATDLLGKHSSIYSARPRLVVANELMGWDFGMGFMTYGDRCAVTEHRPQLLRASGNLLNRFLDFADEHVITNVRHMAGETILSVAYGIEVKQRDDPYIAISEENVEAVTIAAIPGTFLVDGIPLLKYVPSWFPGTNWKRKAKEWRDSSIMMINLPFEVVKRDI